MFNLQRDYYYTCRELGIHLDEYQYLDTIEIEADRLPQPVEEIMETWGEAMTHNANIFEPF